MCREKINLPSHKIPINLVIDVVTLYGINPFISFEKVKEYIGKGDSYVRSAISTAKLLKMLTINGNQSVANPICVDLLGKTPNHEKKVAVFRKFLQGWEPFIMFIQYCMNGDDPIEAARKTYVVNSISNKDYIFLKDLLISWGTELEVFLFDNKGSSLILNKKILEQKNEIQENNLILEKDMAIRLIIAERIGEDLYNFLDHYEIEELVDAYMKYLNDPRGAIECCARTFEDFLRRISSEIDLSKSNGIGQIVNRLYHNKNDVGKLVNIIHSKHLSVGSAIGDIRNMAGHSKESKSMERWDLSIEASKAFIDLTTITMKSIYFYVKDNRYIF